MGIGFTHAELIDEDTFGTIDEAEFFDFCGERRYLDDLEGAADVVLCMLSVCYIELLIRIPAVGCDDRVGICEQGIRVAALRDRLRRRCAKSSAAPVHQR